MQCCAGGASDATALASPRRVSVEKESSALRRGGWGALRLALGLRHTSQGTSQERRPMRTSSICCSHSHVGTTVQQLEPAPRPAALHHAPGSLPPPLVPGRFPPHMQPARQPSSPNARPHHQDCPRPRPALVSAAHTCALADHDARPHRARRGEAARRRAPHRSAPPGPTARLGGSSGPDSLHRRWMARVANPRPASSSGGATRTRTSCRATARPSPPPPTARPAAPMARSRRATRTATRRARPQ